MLNSAVRSSILEKNNERRRSSMGVDVSGALSRQVERICTDSDSSTDEDDKEDHEQERSSNPAALSASLGSNLGVGDARDTEASRPGISARIHPSVTATALNNGSNRNSSSLRQRSSSIKFPIRHTIAQKLRARVEQTDAKVEALQPAKDPGNVDDNGNDDEDERDIPDLPTHAATSNHWRRTAFPEGGHYKGTFYVPSKKSWYILLPHNRFRTAWDIFMTCLLLILAFYIPFRVCFYFDEDIGTDRQAIFWIELAADCLFAIDIVLNFLTAYG